MREESSFIVVEVSMERAGDEGQDLHAGGDPCCRERGLLADGVGDDGGGLAVGVDEDRRSKIAGVEMHAADHDFVPLDRVVRPCCDSKAADCRGGADAHGVVVIPHAVGRDKRVHG